MSDYHCKIVPHEMRITNNNMRTTKEIQDMHTVILAPWIDNCLAVTKLLKVGCLPYAVGKQPSIPLIYLGKTWTLN